MGSAAPRCIGTGLYGWFFQRQENLLGATEPLSLGRRAGARDGRGAGAIGFGSRVLQFSLSSGARQKVLILAVRKNRNDVAGDTVHRGQIDSYRWTNRES